LWSSTNYGVVLQPLPPVSFAKNGIGLDEDVRGWFNTKVPRTTVARRCIARALEK